jgi:hypothetical protein
VNKVLQLPPPLYRGKEKRSKLINRNSIKDDKASALLETIQYFELLPRCNKLEQRIGELADYIEISNERSKATYE